MKLNEDAAKNFCITSWQILEISCDTSGAVQWTTTLDILSKRDTFGQERAEYLHPQTPLTSSIEK